MYVLNFCFVAVWSLYKIEKHMSQDHVVLRKMYRLLYQKRVLT